MPFSVFMIREKLDWNQSQFQAESQLTM